MTPAYYSWSAVTNCSGPQQGRATLVCTLRRFVGQAFVGPLSISVGPVWNFYRTLSRLFNRNTCCTM